MLGGRNTTARFAWPLTALRWSGIGLVSSSWLSGAIFGLYIVAFYLSALPGQHLARWNDNLPGLYAHGYRFAVASIGAHLAAGSAILLLGPTGAPAFSELCRPAFSRAAATYRPLTPRLPFQIHRC